LVMRAMPKDDEDKYGRKRTRGKKVTVTTRLISD